MFEKESKEYRANLVSKLRDKIQNGYNCKELSDIELAFQKGAELGYCKANKLHFIKDGDLPKENQEVLVYFTLPDKSKNSTIIARFKDNDFDFVDLQDVIAWCELPTFNEVIYGE